MTKIPDDKLDTFIETFEENGLAHAYTVYENELIKLEMPELLALLPLVHIDYGDNNRIDKEELQRVMHEATWNDFILGYKQVTNRDISNLF